MPAKETTLKAAIEKLATADGRSVNQSASQAAESYFAGRRGRGDVDKALAFLSRSGGEVPRLEDQLPD